MNTNKLITNAKPVLVRLWNVGITLSMATCFIWVLSVCVYMASGSIDKQYLSISLVCSAITVVAPLLLTFIATGKAVVFLKAKA